MIMRVLRISMFCVAAILATGPRASAQDPVTAARELYAAAQYEDALAMLDNLAPSAHAPEQQSIELYRTLCLLAVGRRDEAEKTIEAMIAQDPLFRPGDDVSPRMRTAFSDARKRVLPSIVQQHYQHAKVAFDRQEFAAAASAFQRVLDTLNDPDIAQSAGQPRLTDLRTLASGFRDLSVKAIPPPPPSVAPPLPVIVPPRIYSGDERGVVAPVVIQQNLPKFPGRVRPTGMTGVVEVLIDEHGAVESARTMVSLGNAYDAMVLAASSGWRYQPATAGGTPVKFRKRIQISVSAHSN
jgi:tetratricopeptide (TPR) repeat protein